MNQKVTNAYKVTDKNMRCNGYQFKLGKVHKQDGKLEICQNGFHACTNLADCFSYYDFNSENRVFEVELYGETATHYNDTKIASLSIKLIRELTWQEVLTLVNIGKDNSGIGNSGIGNSGDWNSGDWNSGIGNSGDWNSGNRNSGNWNSGNGNSGIGNSGDRNSGFFNSDTPPVRAFNKYMADRTHEQYAENIPYFHLPITEWINFSDMTNDEKNAYPNAKTCGGYLKTYSYKEAWKTAWNGLDQKTKNQFINLPGFDADVFCEITGIRI